MSALWKRRRGNTQLDAFPRCSFSSKDVIERSCSSLTTCSEFGAVPLISCPNLRNSRTSQRRVQLPSEYDVLEILGQGAAGKVLRARKPDGVEVAIKVMQANDEEELRGRRLEFDILSTLSHPHLVQALDFLQSHFQAAVVLSYHPGQSLDLAVKGQPFPERIARRLFHQLMSAISYLHNQGVLHRDVKAENILVSPDHQNMHLADFNTAKAVQDGGALTMTGTMEYSAPEVLDGNSPSHGQDVWGCGLCLHMMLSARLPQRLHSFSSLEAFASAQRSCPVKWQHLRNDLTPACKAVLSHCLCVEEMSRPSAAEIFAMEWTSESFDL